MDSRDRLEAIGQQIIAGIDDLRRATCPTCHMQNLAPIFAEQHLIIKCQAPISVAGDTESEFDVLMCPYSQIVYLTPITSGPFTLKFADSEPKRPIKAAPPKKKPTTRRRKTQQ